MRLKPIFKQAFVHTWRKPLLWLFGFLALPLISNEIAVVLIHIERANKWLTSLFVFKDFHFVQIIRAVGLEGINSALLFNLIFTLALGIFGLWLVFWSEITLFRQSVQPTPQLDIKTAIQQSKKPLSTVVGINIAAFIVQAGLFFAFGFPLVNLEGPVKLTALFFLFLLIVLKIIISYLTRFTACNAAIKEEGLIPSLKKAGVLFAKNWITCLKTSLFIFIIGLLAGLAFLLVSLGTSIPFIVATNLFLQLQWPIGFQWITILWMLFLGGLFLVLVSLYSAWQFSVWATVFKKARQ